MRGGGARPGERGAATAELAVALPSLVIVLAVSLAAIDLGVSQVRCVDAARVGARLLARGDTPLQALAEARAAAPAGARVRVATADQRVTVTVTASVPGLLTPLGGIIAPEATAVARLESAP